MGLFSEIGDSFRELGQIFKDFGDEMQEIIVDGSKEMLINGESHYETSVEIREEADEIKKQADCLLYDKRKLVEQKFANADIMQNKVLSSRQKVLRDAPIIVRDKLKRIALNAPSTPSYSTESGKRVSFEQHYNSQFMSCGISSSDFLSGNSSSLLSILSVSSQIRERREAAYSYRNRAKDYRVRIKQICAEADRVLVDLERTYSAMEEEFRVHQVVLQAARVNPTFNVEEVYRILNALQYISVEDTQYRKQISELKGKVRV